MAVHPVGGHLEFVKAGRGKHRTWEIWRHVFLEVNRSLSECSNRKDNENSYLVNFDSSEEARDRLSAIVAGGGAFLVSQAGPRQKLGNVVQVPKHLSSPTFQRWATISGPWIFQARSRGEICTLGIADDLSWRVRSLMIL